MNSSSIRRDSSRGEPQLMMNSSPIQLFGEPKIGGVQQALVQIPAIFVEKRRVNQGSIGIKHLLSLLMKFTQTKNTINAGAAFSKIVW